MTALDTGTGSSRVAWIYRWLIAAVCLSAVLVAAILVVVVMATRRRSRDDQDVELKRRQEKYFDTLHGATSGADGYYNWTHDVVASSA